MGKRLVLVVDDDQGVVHVLAEILQSYQVKGVTDPRDGMLYCWETAVDLILTDQQMPAMKGTDFLRHLRRQGSTTPAILMTGETSEKLIREARRVGAFAVILKPFRAETVRAVVKKALEASGILDPYVY